MKCQSCGGQLREHQKFCIKCGAPTDITIEYCSRCSATLTANAKFCTSCGLKQVIKQVEEEIKLVEKNEDEVRAYFHELCDTEIDNINIKEYIEKFDIIRKSRINFDKSQKLKVLLNGSSVILMHYSTRPYLIRALQSYNDAFDLANELSLDDLANKIRAVLINLNIKFGDLIPYPQKRTKYYDTAYTMIKELEREVEIGDITGDDIIDVYMLKTELYQRKGRIKDALTTVEIAERLCNTFPEKIEDVLLLKADIFESSARYEEVAEILEKVGVSKEKQLLLAKINSVGSSQDTTIKIYNDLLSSKILESNQRISVRMEITKILLETHPQEAKTAFKLIFDEEIDPDKKKKLLELDKAIDSYIKKQSIPEEIHLGNAIKEINSHRKIVRENLGKKNWLEVVKYSRRILENLHDYHGRIDKEDTYAAEINFKNADALYNLEEFDLAYAYFEIALGYFERGFGEPTDVPTTIKHIVDVQVKLGMYLEAFESAKRGLDKAEEIKHPALIKEFNNRLKNLNPERIENLMRLNVLINVAINELSSPSTLSSYLRILGLKTTEVTTLSSLFKIMVISLLRSDFTLGKILLNNVNIKQTIHKILINPRIAKIYENPKKTMKSTSNLDLLTDFSLSNRVPIEIMQVLIADATAKLTIAISIRSAEFTQQELEMHTIRSLTSFKLEFFAVMCLAVLVKLIEGRVNL